MFCQTLNNHKKTFVTVCLISALLTALGVLRSSLVPASGQQAAPNSDVVSDISTASYKKGLAALRVLRSSLAPAAINADVNDISTPRSPSYEYKTERDRMVSRPTSDSKYEYAPMNTEFLSASFHQLKRIVKPLSRRYANNVDELMVHRLPVVDTSGWQLQRTDGRALTVREAQQLVRDPNYPVPNAAHYILPFADPNLQFHHLVCILSGFWVMRADHVFLWSSVQPSGPNWDLLQQNLTLSGVWETRVVIARRAVPKFVYRQPLNGREHQSDVMRMEALLVFGGAYFDLDVIALKSMTPLRARSFTIGRELPANLCNGVFLSAPNSSLLALWHTAYQTFDETGWGEHSLMLPNELCRAFAAHCHVEQDSLDRPNFLAREIKLIYGQERGWDWRQKNYAMHLWYRSHKKQYTMETIKYVDSMLGDMFRYVLYGNSSMF